MPQQPRFGAVVFAKDLARMAKFYADTLSLAVVNAEPDHVVLESPGCQLVIHAIPKAIADTIEIASPPLRRTETPIKLYFFVDRIAEVRVRAAALGGGFNAKGREWEARGFRACDGHDPEGNVLQVREAID